MVFVNIDCGTSVQTVHEISSGTRTKDVLAYLESNFGLNPENFYLTQNGRLLYDTDALVEETATLRCRFLGGKGGFGSMLRAIGAQIEKTTNREACRDLSGRRLRDINEEKRLKAWIEKQPEREQEAEEKRKRKLQKLCEQPKHEFNDKQYEEQRTKMMEQICDAVEAGLKSASGEKRHNENEPPVKAKKQRKGLLDEELELDLSDLEDSEEEEEKSVVKVAN